MFMDLTDAQWAILKALLHSPSNRQVVVNLPCGTTNVLSAFDGRSRMRQPFATLLPTIGLTSPPIMPLG